MLTNKTHNLPNSSVARRSFGILLIASAALFSFNQTAHANNAPATPERPVPEIEWDTTINKFRYDANKFVGQRLTVRCPPATVDRKQTPIYGTDFYPSETPICQAALHAGMITDKGGLVTIQINPGKPEYVGSDRNDVVSLDLPGTERSISFVGGPGAKETDAIHLKRIPRLKWDTGFTRTGFAYRDLIGQRFTFRLPPLPTNQKARLVFGTDEYEFASKVGWAVCTQASCREKAES